MPDWDMTNTTNTSSFFYSCKKLNYIDLSRSNDTTITKIATLVPAKTLATYGQILIPVDSSQANIDALVAKYWKPVGPRLDMTSCEIATELDEIKPGKSTKLYYGNSEPWYGNDYNVEYISSDESVATIEGNVITSTGVEGTTEITARIIDTQEVISVAPITLVVSKTDNYPNIIKFRLSKIPSEFTDIITVNGFNKRKNYFDYNPFSDIYTYDEGKPITSFKFLSSLKEIIKLNVSNITDMEEMFYGMDSLIFVDDLNNWDTSNVTNMKQMFHGCKSLTELDVSNWNTDNVTNMNNTFYNCQALTSLDLSNWDTSNVTTINHMFANCSSLKILDLSNFNIEKLETYNCCYMLQNCDSLHTLRLDNCSNDTINKIITSDSFPTNAIEGVTRKIFCKKSEAAGLTAPTNWVFEFVKDIPLYEGQGQFNLNGSITEVEVMVDKSHTSLYYMFDQCISLSSVNTQDWDTSNVTNMDHTFSECDSLVSLDLSNFNTDKVTNMNSMFYYCWNLESLNISNFNMVNVTNTAKMFSKCPNLAELRLDNCNSITIEKIITSSEFSTNTIAGKTRKIYCKEANAAGLTAPTNWVFEYVE
jgi:surface protein